MVFSYRYDDDDISNYDRYKYSYVAQFGCIEDEIKTCATRIHLPRKANGNLRDGDNVTYFVYAEYRVVVNERTIFIEKLEAINFDDKLHMTSTTDRVIEFFANELLRDMHYIDFYVTPADAPVATSVWDNVGPPINIRNINFEIKLKRLITDADIGRTIDYTETDEKKLTLAWFVSDPNRRCN